MAKLLYIESSPRKDRSASIDVARTFLDAYRKSHPDDTVQTIDLWKAKLPSFEGYKGLVTGKPAALIYARGGAYGSGTGAEGYDYQKTYMEQVLGFIGFTGIQSIIIEPTLMSTPEEKKKLMASASEEARQVASGF